jgi:hypothetical protein
MAKPSKILTLKLHRNNITPTAHQIVSVLLGVKIEKNPILPKSTDTASNRSLLDTVSVPLNFSLLQSLHF